MQIKAKKMRIGDQLREGTTVVALTRKDGHTFAKLNDARQLICVDSFILDVKREYDKTPEVSPEGFDLDAPPVGRRSTWN